MYGLSYQLVDGWDGFRAGVRQSLSSPGVGLVEVRTDRRANARLHRELWDEVSRALRQRDPEGAAL
jgi:2-succinyl-5-enolpyruvyl-6-hydroxy-3-cyclohexene-1-carboxylate synthase